MFLDRLAPPSILHWEETGKWANIEECHKHAEFKIPSRPSKIRQYLYVSNLLMIFTWRVTFTEDWIYEVYCWNSYQKMNTTLHQTETDFAAYLEVKRSLYFNDLLIAIYILLHIFCLTTFTENYIVLKPLPLATYP